MPATTPLLPPPPPLLPPPHPTRTLPSTMRGQQVFYWPLLHEAPQISPRHQRATVPSQNVLPGRKEPQCTASCRGLKGSNASRLTLYNTHIHISLPLCLTKRALVFKLARTWTAHPQHSPLLRQSSSMAYTDYCRLEGDPKATPLDRLPYQFWATFI
jgi:hypothetical protein